jgi:hypothetical protein
MSICEICGYLIILSLISKNIDHKLYELPQIEILEINILIKQLI